MEVNVLNIKGQETGRTATLNDEIYGIEPNDHVLYLDVKQYLANQRQGTHKAKERSEHKGSTRKLGRQKGGGGARHGDINSPLMRGGGRVFGPHGDHLVVADSVLDYDEAASLLLTKKTITSNLKTRELGFKPYIAPALSSGSLSLLSLLRGEWQYSSLSFGSAFLGVRNRLTPEGREVEDLPLDDRLFERIEAAYADLKGYAFDGQA